MASRSSEIYNKTKVCLLAEVCYFQTRFSSGIDSVWERDYITNSYIRGLSRPCRFDLVFDVLMSYRLFTKTLPEGRTTDREMLPQFVFPERVELEVDRERSRHSIYSTRIFDLIMKAQPIGLQLLTAIVRTLLVHQLSICPIMYAHQLLSTKVISRSFVLRPDIPCPMLASWFNVTATRTLLTHMSEHKDCGFTMPWEWSRCAQAVRVETTI